MASVILLPTIAVYTCSATFNESRFLQTEEPKNGISPPDQAKNNFSLHPKLEIQGVLEGVKETERFKLQRWVNDQMEWLEHNCSSFLECGVPGISLDQALPAVTDLEREVNITSHLYNSTDLTAEELFKNALRISDDAVLFLKGSMVTRVMPSFYIFLFIISLPLNTLALLTFTCKIKEKKPAVIFMSNLACVDLLFTLLLPLKIHYHLNGSHWVFGEAACRVLTSAFYCYMYCSILLMMCMSVDRLMAMLFPFASLTWRSVKNSVYVCAVVWLLAIAGTIPRLSITQTFNVKHVGITCHDVSLYDAADQKYVYLFSILSCLFFFLPLVVTLLCYSTIIISLSKSGRLATSSSSSTSDQRRRAVMMFIAVLIEFVVCFAPTNVILLYHCVLLATGSVDGEGNTSYMTYMLALCAGCSSVFLDPLLYYYGSFECKQQIRSVLRWRRTKKASNISST